MIMTIKPLSSQFTFTYAAQIIQQQNFSFLYEFFFSPNTNFFPSLSARAMSKLQTDANMLIPTDLILASGTGLRNIVIVVSLELGASQVTSVDGSRLQLMKTDCSPGEHSACGYRGLQFISIYEPHIYGIGACTSEQIKAVS